MAEVARGVTPIGGDVTGTTGNASVRLRSDDSAVVVGICRSRGARAAVAAAHPSGPRYPSKTRFTALAISSSTRW